MTLGVDVGGTKILGLALDPAGAVLAEVKTPTPRWIASAPGADPDGDVIVDAIATVAERLLAALGPATVAGVGVGVPGLVDDAGVLRYAPNLPGGEGLGVGDRLAERLREHRIVVDNDATCAALGEW